MHFLKKLKKYFNTKEKRHQTDVFKLLITKENFSLLLISFESIYLHKE